MDKTEFLNKITEIGSCEDDAQRRELLTQLQEDCSSVFDRNAELESANENLSTDNETLRSANMKLFLRVGESKKPANDGSEDEPKTKREFKNLFNEKGGIK